MSLVQHLRGELGQALAGLCPNVRDVAAAVGNQTGPVIKPDQRMPLGHYSAVGSIVGQRLADAIEPAPPYPALFGAMACSALSASDAGVQASGYPTHQRRIPTGSQARSALFIRPTPSGWWTWGAAAEGGQPPEGRIVDVLDQHLTYSLRGRTGQLGNSAHESERLESLHVLQMLEDIYRGGGDLQQLQHVADTGRAAVSAPVRDDVLRVLAANHDTLQQVTRLSTGNRLGHLGHAAPLFVPHWAEGDVLVGPHPHDGGYTLLDVKTVTSADPQRIAEWLRQVIAYALLDTAGRWRITRIGLWLPRQSLLVGWKVSDLIGDVEAVRQQWLPLARRAARSDGADPALLFEDSRSSA